MSTDARSDPLRNPIIQVPTSSMRSWTSNVNPGSSRYTKASCARFFASSSVSSLGVDDPRASIPTMGNILMLLIGSYSIQLSQVCSSDRQNNVGPLTGIIPTMATVRLFVSDVERAQNFYENALGFELIESWGPALSIVGRDDLQLWLSGPATSAARPWADGTQPISGGFTRIVLPLEDWELRPRRSASTAAGWSMGRFRVPAELRSSHATPMATASSSSSDAARRLYAPGEASLDRRVSTAAC